MDHLPGRLRAELTAAIKRRDDVGIAALRCALAAIENAGAVAVTGAPSSPAASEHVAGAAPGLYAGETQRRALGPGDERRIVEIETDQLHAAAAQYGRLGRRGEAARVRAEAEVLERFLEADGPAKSD